MKQALAAVADAAHKIVHRFADNGDSEDVEYVARLLEHGASDVVQRVLAAKGAGSLAEAHAHMNEARRSITAVAGIAVAMLAADVEVVEPEQPALVH